MQGVNIAVSQTQEELAELRTRNRIAYDASEQRAKQTLSEYILYFDKLVNNLQCYSWHWFAFLVVIFMYIYTSFPLLHLLLYTLIYYSK